jgi:hypothetical protein
MNTRFLRAGPAIALIAGLLPAACLTGPGSTTCSEVAETLCSAACDCTSAEGCSVTHQDGSISNYASQEECSAHYEPLLCGDEVSVDECRDEARAPACTSPEGTLALAAVCDLD